MRKLLAVVFGVTVYGFFGVTWAYFIGFLGGFPVPNGRQDGGYINYPDVDMRDPVQNTSGVPWYSIIWKDNYPRLQRVKNTYDPKNVFRHALSLDPA